MPPRSRRSQPPPRREGEGPKSWGGVARRGAGNVRDGGAPGKASKAWREAAGLGDESRPRWQPERWVEEPEPVREEAGRAVSRGQRPGPTGSGRRRREDDKKRPAARAERAAEKPASSTNVKRTRSRQRLAEAARAFEEEHYRDARRLLAPLAEQEPELAPVRELYGLTLYRLGRWKDAIVELDAFERLTGTLEQHPVLADCYRALKRWKKVDELWDDLRRASPGADLVNEGRIVAAGALADRGNLKGAISLLEKAPEPRRPKPRHLRLWYALADLEERAGNVPRARSLFDRVRRQDAGFADVAERLAALR